MPGRVLPLVTKQIYHVFNRGINRCPTFTSKKEYLRALNSIKYYQNVNPPISLSKYLNRGTEKKGEIFQLITKKEKLITLFCFCLMPNHFHLLLKQEKDRGISKFMSNFQNSYTRYFNIKNNRDGSLFLDQFKAVRIETDEQLIYVSRYIHLNPHTNFVVNSINDLENYPWSSLSAYIKNDAALVNKEQIMSNFKNGDDYRKFVTDQADYQRRLKEIRHLLFD